MDAVSDEQCSTSPKRLKLHHMEPTTSQTLPSPLNTISSQEDDTKDLSKESPSEEKSVIDAEDALFRLDSTPENKLEDTDDNFDDSSSTCSGQGWKPQPKYPVGMLNWIERHMLKGTDPRLILTVLFGDSSSIPDVPDLEIWKIIFSLMSEYPPRPRLPSPNSLKDVINLLKTCKKIIVLTGAGVSVSCGIPDFRSRDGVYARLAVDFPDLPDPQSMFSIDYFRINPKPFFKFAQEIYPGQFKPSPGHRFIKLLEKKNKLLRNYTQNIDTLERVAGIENVVECHGSFSSATCTKCGTKKTADEIKEDIFQQRVPYCENCSGASEESERGIMKPDIVFFGEGLPETFHEAMTKDKDECDLLIVIGSSLNVHPVALIPHSIPGHVPQILINRERLGMKFDVELLGDSDVIIDHLCRELGGDWEEEICWNKPLTFCNKTKDTVLNQSSCSHDIDEAIGCTDESDSIDIKCKKIGKRHINTGDSSGASASEDERTRHMSLDSSRDSGIGEASNSSVDTRLSVTPTTDQELNNNNFYFRMSKRKYVFPGSEIYQKFLKME